MKLHTKLLTVAVIALTSIFAKAEKETCVYEYTDPETALHWISLTIEGTSVSGDITKYLDESMKEKMGVEKFTGKVISGKGTENLKLEITFKNKPTDMGDVGNVRVNKSGKSVWNLKPSDSLVVPMFFYINQGYEEDADFRYLSPN
jgi:hypothetical protein